ncbi:MAG TPA: class II aldolase/adducin family protein [Candidatus Polarisedimenticolia bacterium]|nr:class II aldolase/adducin family protein [Candidatus Polarisedimenticolia bacterium]
MTDLKHLREEVLQANLGVYRADLVTMHSGNASAVERRSGRVVIKPSGMDYEKLSADFWVVTDPAGRRIKTGTEGNPSPIPVSTCRTISMSTSIARRFVGLCIPTPTAPLALLC